MNCALLSTFAPVLMSFTEFEEFKSLMLSYKSSPPASLNKALDVVSKENLMIGAGLGDLSLGSNSADAKSSGKIAVGLSPASREAKDAGLPLPLSP